LLLDVLEAVNEIDVVEELRKWHHITFDGWRDKGCATESRHYSGMVGRFSYVSDRFWRNCSGKKFEVGITDYEGQLRSK
jgi:hypothetical protein